MYMYMYMYITKCIPNARTGAYMLKHICANLRVHTQMSMHACSHIDKRTFTNFERKRTPQLFVSDYVCTISYSATTQCMDIAT